jgi:ERCC4-type nuclease
MKRKPDLLVDSNERGPFCQSVMRKAEKAGLSVERKSLLVGDYLLGEACVEAKSLDDFFMSRNKGHLWKQLDNMDANYPRFFLVIHGEISKYVAMAKRNENRKQRVSYTSVQNELIGTIARIKADFDCQVFYTEQQSLAALFIVKLHNKLHTPASRHGAKALKRVSTNDVRLDMLMTIPGVGRELGEKLLEQCDSLEEMRYEESMRGIKGLGKVLKRRIIDVLTSEEPVKFERKMRR